MIYVSSACVKHDKIKDSVEELACNGFKNIELSGGTKYYREYEEDLLKLRDQYQLNYLVHNYFPPPQEDFILNLASLDEGIYQRTVDHYMRAISLSRKLGAGKFGLHAGLFIDVALKEIGKNISLTRLSDRAKAFKQFCEGYRYLSQKADGVELYIENNVFSKGNAQTYQGQVPFMLVDYAGYCELKSRIDFKLLLDVAHLKVSSNSLGGDFVAQLNEMIFIADYIHLSDNDGLYDQGRCFNEDSELLTVLRRHDFTHKIITSETSGAIEDVKRSQFILARSLCLNVQ